MYFSNLELFVIVFIFIFEFAIGIISAYGWLVEADKRKKAEQTIKYLYDKEMCAIRSTDIMSRDYGQYIKEVEKSIKKERSKNNVYL